MITLSAGALLERPPGPKYLEKLRFAEVRTEETLPRPSKLKAYRDPVPKDFVYSLVLPRSCFVAEGNRLRAPGQERESDLQWAKEAVATLAARFVVMDTGSAMTTGQRDRDLLAGYVESARKHLGEGVTLVWAAGGLWEPETHGDFAQKLGLTPAIDPLATVPQAPGP
ncbi:MAG: hypothetical protein KC416_14690, partial [Myxococcales bacterium]|nr:hypothetical protein [Myxococcales bacterium]